MSYCRASDHSDVYIINSGHNLECMTGFEAADKADIHHFHAISQDGPHPELDMLLYLHDIMPKGIRVPDYAIKRLFKEAKERALKMATTDSFGLNMQGETE